VLDGERKHTRKKRSLDLYLRTIENYYEETVDARDSFKEMIKD